MNLEWIIKDGEKFIIAVNADITDALEVELDPFKVYPEARIMDEVTE